MKRPLLSCAVLLALLAASLWNAGQIDRDTRRWCGAVEEARHAAEASDWDAACRTLNETYETWLGRQSYLHVVVSHKDLDDPDALFRKAIVYAEQREKAEFLATAAELTARLRLIAETQKLSAPNVF